MNHVLQKISSSLILWAMVALFPASIMASNVGMTVLSKDNVSQNNAIIVPDLSDERTEVPTIGYFRTTSKTTWEAVARRLGVDAAKLSRFNLSSLSDPVLADEFIMVPLDDALKVDLLTDDKLLTMRAAGTEKESFFKRLKSKLNEQLSIEGTAKFVTKGLQVTKQVIEKGDAKGSALVLGETYAAAAARTVIDAGVETVRQIPQVRALDVQYKLPITSGRKPEINANMVVALVEIDETGSMIFNQLGLLTHNDRWTSNWGFGYRWLADDKTLLLGTNAFLDWDMSKGHTRFGMGAEASTQYLDLFSNFYTPVSGTTYVKGLKERPASGFDLGIVGRLPYLSSIDWEMQYGKWYGDHVDVYDNNQYTKNPETLAFGVKWRPVNSLSFGINHSRVLGTKTDETRLEGRFMISFGEGADNVLAKHKAGETNFIKNRINRPVKRQNRIIYKRNSAGGGVFPPFPFLIPG